MDIRTLCSSDPHQDALDASKALPLQFHTHSLPLTSSERGKLFRNRLKKYVATLERATKELRLQVHELLTRRVTIAALSAQRRAAVESGELFVRTVQEYFTLL